MNTNDYHEPMTVTRRAALKAGTLATAAAVGLPLGIARTGAASSRTAILGETDATAANAGVTTDEQYTRRASWVVDGDGDGAGGDDKMFLWIDPTTGPINLGSFTIDDIERVVYRSKTDHPTNGATPPNFALSIYTVPDGRNDDKSWYGYRLNAEPYFSRNLDAPADVWNEWDTDAGTNQLTFYDSNRAGVGFGFYGGQPTLQELQAGAIDWSDRKSGAAATDIDYGAETVKSLVVTTGSGWSDTFTGFVDTIVIEVSTGPGRSGKGQSLTIDLEGGRGR